MAVTYGFYDSLNHDRLYNAQQMSAIFDGIINDGVFMSVGNQFHTVAGTGMQVIVKSGRAWFDSTWTLNDAEYPLSIDAADVLLTRIDAVVLEVNSEVAPRANTIKVVKGTPASTPAKPTLTNTATIHQHALAYVTVAKNITAITNSMIEIVVGKTETPYVTAILQTTDITDLYNQWEDYFQTWFDTVRGTLDGDVALNLQNQITSLRRETLKNTTPPIIGLSASSTPDDMFQALAKTGDLHVWRKTIVTAQKIPARYTLGTRQKIKLFYMYGADGISISYSSSIIVYDNGDIALSKPSTINVKISSNSFTNQFSVLKGMFVKISTTKDSASAEPGVHFIPTDATYSVTGADPSTNFYCNNCQTVTSYAAIPAGTIIEYLGKLGDKSRVQVVSYVGTGTYGKDHPSSITFDFVPKIAIAITTTHVNQSNENIDSTMVFDTLTTNMHDYYGFSAAAVNYPSYGKKSSNGKTFSWYNTKNAYTQLNESGNKYYILAIG